jgi:hypothetical protein
LFVLLLQVYGLEHNYYANYFFVKVVERGLVIGISRSEGLDMRVYWGNRRNSFEEWRVYICVNPGLKIETWGTRLSVQPPHQVCPNRRVLGVHRVMVQTIERIALLNPHCHSCSSIPRFGSNSTLGTRDGLLQSYEVFSGCGKTRRAEKNGPQRLKPRPERRTYGTAEAMPFQNRFMR